MTASRQVLAVIGFTALVRLLLTAQMDLQSVEAYHWLLAERPALGYVDHPGMQAWICRMSTSLLGDTPVGLRALFIVGASLTVWLVFLTGRKLYDERTGRTAAMAAALLPMFFTNMVEVKPDAPLYLFWAATLWALAHALGGGSPRCWYLSGLFLGLAMESKYHAAFLALGIPAYLVLSPEHRFWIRRKEPWLGVMISLAVFAPAVIWNARNGWQSFLMQSVGRVHSSEFDAGRALNYPARQLVLITPAVCLWAWTCGFWVLWRWRTSDWNSRLLAATGMPLLIFFFLMSIVRNVKGYWPGPAYMSALIISSAAVERGGIWGPIFHRSTFGVLAAFYLVAPALAAFVPAEKRFAWSRLGAEVRSRPSDFVICSEYHLASNVALATNSLDVWDFTPVGRPAKSFPLWWSPGTYLGMDATVVYEGTPSAEDVERVRASFERVDPPEEVFIARVRLWGSKEKERYWIQNARVYRGARSPERALDRYPD